MKYGLIGEHLSHSFSGDIHAKIASYEYELRELAPEALSAFMQERDFLGINVTIPYKQAVIPFLSEIDDAAKKIGAVNTVVNRDGRLFGYNTDFAGLRALILHAGLDFSGAKVLILGTGGTSHTARAVSQALGAASIFTVGRRAKDGCITYEEAYARHADADFLINTTPCGMYPYPDGNEKIAGIPVDLEKFPALRGAVAAAEIFLGKSLGEVLTTKIYHEIRAEKENIVLTGMPGSGKTTVGLYLAEKTGRRFLDTDAMIIQKTGKEITDLFAKIGNDGFRALETEAVAEAANTTGTVIATGGGAILSDDNIRALKRTGRIYFLNRSLEHIVPTADRPLALDKEALAARFAERYDRYLATCDRQIVTDENVFHTAKAIEEDFYHADSCHQRTES